MSADIVGIPRGYLHDIPSLMEAAAKRVRNGDFGTVESGACVLLRADGNIEVFGWGRTDAVHTIGLFSLGAQWLSTHKEVRE